MPEVGEVAITAQFLNQMMQDKKMTDIKILSGRYKKTKPEGFDMLKKALPLTVKGVGSKGKFMYICLDDDITIWNTFALKGLWSTSKDDYARISVSVGGKTYYYCDSINYGTFKVSNDSEALEKKIKSLTPDFLKDEFSLKDITKYKQPLVKLLHNQTKLGSGLGNYLIAEVLYRAKLSPHRLGSSLTPKEIKALEHSIKYTTKLAYAKNHTGYIAEICASCVKRINYHPDVKLGKAAFEYQVYRQKEDPKGNKVIADKIMPSQLTYWVPEVQK